MEPVHGYGPVAMPHREELLLRGGKSQSLRQLSARCGARRQLGTRTCPRAADSARCVRWEDELARLRLPARAARAGARPQINPR